MKKTSLLTLMIAASSIAGAQGVASMDEDIRFGFKAGVNMTNLAAKNFTATPEPQTAGKTSYYVGGFMNLPLGDFVKFQPEVVFSSQGSKMQETRTLAEGASMTYNYEEVLHYLNIPMLFQLQTPRGFVVETGPQLGLILNAVQKGTSPISTTNKTDLLPFRRDADLSWALGVGYQLPIGVGISARYNYGLSNIVNQKNGSTGELRNRVWQFGLSYQFDAYQ